MRKYVILLIVLVSAVASAQSVNDYKYVIVPSRFELSKKQNPFGLSMLTKSLMEKYGFVAYLDTEIPGEIRDSNCDKLYADVIERNNISKTRMIIVLKDCSNKVLFASDEGMSREKDWQQGYTEAFRNAAKSFDKLNYHYNGTVAQVQNNIVKPANDKQTIKTETIAAPIRQQFGAPLLYAQPILNGYQLVDTTPKLVMTIYITGSKDLYIAEKEALKGMLRKSDGSWIFEYYIDGQLKTEFVNIKF